MLLVYYHIVEPGFEQIGYQVFYFMIGYSLCESFKWKSFSLFLTYGSASGIQSAYSPY